MIADDGAVVGASPALGAGDGPVDSSAMKEPRLPRREGLARIGLRAHGRTTSISMDALLYRVLIANMGSAKAVQEWAQKVAAEIEALEAQGVVMAPRDVRASLSRLVQRQAVRKLWPDNSVGCRQSVPEAECERP